MSLEATLLAIVLTGALAVFVLLPILEGDEEPEGQFVARVGSPRQRRALETLWAEKNRILRTIHDLDFDYDLGKLTDEVYTDQRVYLIRLFVAIIERMDAIERDIARQAERIEAAVAALRQAR